MPIDIRGNSDNIKTISGKQATLVSGTNIKTVNGTSLLGSGDIVISGGGGSYSADGTTVCATSNVFSVLPVCNTKWSGKQDLLTAGNAMTIASNVICVTAACDTKWSTDTNTIATADGTTLSASSNVFSVLAACNTAWSGKQAALVSGTNIKTINGSSILGSGDLVIAGGGGSSWGAITGTIASQTDLVSCFAAKQNTLVSGTSIKTVNGNSLLGSGDLVIAGGGGSATPDGITISTDSSSKLCILSSCEQKWNNALPWSVSTSVDCSISSSVSTSTLDKTVGIVFSASNLNANAAGSLNRACITTTSVTCGALSCSIIINRSSSANYSCLDSVATTQSSFSRLTLIGCCTNTLSSALLYSTNCTYVSGGNLTQIGNCEAGCTYIAGICLLLCGLPTANPSRMCQLWLCNGYVVSGTPGTIGGGSETLGTAIASAANLALTSSSGNSIHITGTTSITSLGTTGTTGQTVKLIFDGALVLTHNATSLINISGANITTAAGDTAVFLNENGASGYWRMLSYQRKNGMALVAPTSVTTSTNSTNATNAKCILNTVSTCRNDGLPIVSSTCNCFTNCINSPGTIAALYSTCLLSATGGSILKNFVSSTGSAASICHCVSSSAASYPSIYCVLATNNTSNSYSCVLLTSCSGTSSQMAWSSLESRSTCGAYNIFSIFNNYTNSVNGSSNGNILLRSTGNGCSTIRISATRDSVNPGTTSQSILILESADIQDSVAAYSTRECILINTSNLKLSRLPTVDPHIVGVLWNNGGVLNISAG